MDIKSNHPDIYLVVLDSARRKSFSCYGAERPLTPCIDALAKDSVVYLQAYSPSFWTQPSHASLFTGKLPSRHGTDGDDLFLDAGQPLLQSLLGDNGYFTCGLSSNRLIGDYFGFSRGFEYFFKIWRLLQGKNPLADDLWFGSFSRSKKYAFADYIKGVANKFYERFQGNVFVDATPSTTRLIDKAIALTKKQGRPMFMFINLMQTHMRYNPPREDMEAVGARPFEKNIDWVDYYTGRVKLSEEEFGLLTGLYEAEVHCADRHFGRLVNAIKRSGRYDGSMIIVTSDHGELIGEHGMFGHLSTLYQELINVPLVVKYPKGFGLAGVTERLVQSHDLFPTILEAAGVADIPETDSVSLLGNRKRDLAVSQLISISHVTDQLRKKNLPLDLVERYSAPKFAVVMDNFIKLIQTGMEREFEVYDIREDPAETTDRYHVTGERERDLYRNILDERMENTGFIRAAKQEFAAEDMETKRRLAALGYL